MNVIIIITDEKRDYNKRKEKCLFIVDLQNLCVRYEIALLAEEDQLMILVN